MIPIKLKIQRKTYQKFRQGLPLSKIITFLIKIFIFKILLNNIFQKVIAIKIPWARSIIIFKNLLN